MTEKSTSKSNIKKRVFRIFSRTILALIVLVLLLFLLINIPFVQKALTQKVSNYLEDKLKTEVNIGYVGWRLPKEVTLQEIYVETPKGDTLFYLQDMGIDVNLFGLFKKKIEVTEIDISNIKGTILMQKDTSNIDFILDAFSSNAEEKETNEKTKITPWDITFSNTLLGLSKADILYESHALGMLLDLDIGSLQGQVDTANVLNNRYFIDNVLLQNSKITYNYLTNPDTSATTSSSKLDFLLGINQAKLENVQYEMTMDKLYLNTIVEEMKTTDVRVHLLEKSVKVDIEKAEISNGIFDLDRLGKPYVDNFDNNHLRFKELNGSLENLEYQDIDLSTDILALSGKTGENIYLKSVKGHLDFSRKGVFLNDFSGKTNGSELNNSKVILEYDFLKDNPNYEDIILDIDTKNATTTISEINYFHPVLKPYFKEDSEVFTFDAKLRGAIKDLQIDYLDLKGVDAQLIANGSIQNSMQPDFLRMDLNIAFFKGQSSTLQRFVSDTLIPRGVLFPQFFNLKGKINGGIQDKLNLDIDANLFQKENSLPTKIKTTGFLENVMADSLKYHFQVDTFLTSQEELMAYLPDNSLPEGYNLPKNISANGRISGTLNSLDSDLYLEAVSNKKASKFKVKGKVYTFNKPKFDIKISDIKLDNYLVYEILPDSLLPASIQLPDITKGRIKLLGTLDDLKANAQISTSAGSLNTEVRLEGEDYTTSFTWRKMDFRKLTQGSLLDTIDKMDLGLVNMVFNAKGKNFEDLKSASGNANFTLQEYESELPGMRVDVVLKNKKLDATILYQDKAGAAEADVFYDLENNYRFNGVLHALDLKQIPYLRTPMVLDGNIDFTTRYDSLSDIKAKLTMRDINFLYNKKNYLLKELLGESDFRGENKKLNIQSDWVDANVNGALDFDNFTKEIKALLNRFLQKEDEKEIFGIQNTTIVSADVNWKNTSFLTSGIIAGLQEIEPFRLNVDFIAARNKLIGDVDFPKIIYQKTEFKDIIGTVKTSENSLDYLLDVKKLILPTDTEMGEVRLDGKINQGILHGHLFNKDSSEITNLDLNFNLENKDEKYHFSFEPDLTLNHSPWNIDPNNEIIYLNENLFIQDLKLYNEQETLTIKSINEEEIKVDFDDFRLEEILSLVQLQNYSGGIINGDIVLKTPLTDLKIDANIDLEKALFYDNPIGNAHLETDNLNKSSIYNINFNLEGEGNDARINGTYDLENKVDAFDLIADIKSLQLAPYEGFLDDYISNFSGQLIGKSEISGTILAPSLVGFIQTKNTNFTIKELGTPLRLGEQKVELDGNAIYFNNFEVLDSTGNKALVNAYILTENYKDFYYDLDVSAKNFMVLNTTEKDNDLYYGTLIVDADAEVKGDLFSPIIEVNASPRKGSKLAYILPSDNGQIDHGDGIVTFINEEKREDISVTDTLQSQLAKALNLRINTNLEINENLDFTAFLNPITGDLFTGKGDGFLSFSMFPSGDMEMSGTITLAEGFYNFVYQGLVKRKFDIVSGSTLKWTGNIYNPDLDLKVQYKVKTAPFPLVASQGAVTEEQQNRLKQKEVFYTELNITGNLEKTNIETSISYPDISENSGNADISAAIDALKSNPNRMNEQAFGLILFNSFFSENFNLGTNILTSQFSINDAISNQLNSLANRYIKFVDVSVGLNTYNKFDETGQSGTQTDFSLTIGKRFFNDRLVVSIDGKSTTSTNAQSQMYLDNLIVEYSITENGFWKIKAYNKREKDDVSSAEIVKTGAALVLTKDFNEFRFFKKKQENKK